MNKEQKITLLKNQIEEANYQYRIGTPIISDIEYDNLIDQLKELNPNDELLKDTGSALSIDNERKVDLPIPMHSFEKVYENDLLKFLNQYKNLPMVASTKYDGAALLIEYRNGELYEAYTKGRENVGQRAKEHAIMLGAPLKLANYNKPVYSVVNKTFIKVEVLMEKDLFSSKYSNMYKNSRNMAAGLLNSKKAPEILKDCVMKAHTLIFDNMRFSKSTQLNTLVEFGFDTVDWWEKDSFPTELQEWEETLLAIKNGNFMADGIVIEVDDWDLRDEIGYHSNGNPKFGIAYKVQYAENTAITTVSNIEWNINKLGQLIPRIQYEPVELNETTCTYAAGFNYKFIADNQLAIGSKIKLQKSGDIIPYITDVINESEPATCFPAVCPSCGQDLLVNDSGVHLVCTNLDCPETNFYKIVGFFKTLDVENFGEALIEKVVKEHNITNFQQLLDLPKSEFIMEGIGEKSATKIYNDIKNKFEKACSQPEILMHATGYFGATLGSKKLKIVVDAFKENMFTVSFNELISLEGFQESSAKAFLNGISRFKNWVDKYNIKLTYPEKKEVVNGSLTGQSFVLTGFRDVELQSKIESMGGKVASGVSKTTTAVITNDINSSSSKVTKAKQLGIKVILRGDFKL